MSGTRPSPSSVTADPFEPSGVQPLRFWRLRSFCRDRAALVGAVVLVGLGLAVLLAPVLSPSDPDAADNLARYASPGTPGHLLGTDSQGRDMLARLLYGGRVSLLVGVLPTGLATVAGLALGLLAGVARGAVDTVVMRLLDVVFAFPMVLLAIAVAGSMRPGLATEVIAIAVVLVPYVARVTRTAVEGVVAMPFVEAARAGGATGATLVWRHVLPNALAPVVVYATTLMGLMIVVGSGLSFLGLGVQPPAADWGAMVAEGRVVLRRAAHVTVLPGCAILIASLAFSFVGDGLRDALDPRTIRR